MRIRDRGLALAVLFSAFGFPAGLGNETPRAAAAEVCEPSGVLREDLLVPTTSTLPGYAGRPAVIDVRAVLPDYGNSVSMGNREKCRTTPHRAVILLHGATTEATVTFDLRFRDYSLMERLAMAGNAAYAVNLLGYGRSTKFGLDDPCNASLANRRTFLVPNPLSHATNDCPTPLTFAFTNTDAAVHQLDAVVDEVRKRAGVDEVSLFGWSRGGVVIGAYASVHPEKIRSLAILASGYDFPSGPPVAGPGALLAVRDRANLFPGWQADPSCPGQRGGDLESPGGAESEIVGAIWAAVRARDPLGASWGPTHPLNGGVQRAPTWDVWGWNSERAAAVTVPALIITGLLDRTNPPEREVRLFNDLGSGNKVLMKIECASHQALYEGSTRWAGPHEAIAEALVQWIASKTFKDADGESHHRGSFLIGRDGSISRG